MGSSLRTTLAVAFAVVAVCVTMLVGFLSYTAAARLVRVDQHSEFTEVVDDLKEQVQRKELTPADYSATDPDHDGPRDDLIRPTRTDVQVLGAGGRIVDHGARNIPVTASDRRIADDTGPGALVRRQTPIGSEDFRLATVSLGGGRGAVQVAQQISSTEDLLRALLERTVLYVTGAFLAAGLIGWWLAKRITGRLVRLTAVAEDVARTGRLESEVPVAGHDEVARLGRSFDGMLGRLARSEESKRRLVQDAGHELRTPLTSLRTNISTLRRFDELPPAAREELVADLADEARELTDLVNELVELAAGQQDDEPVTRLVLGDVAEEAAALARRRTGREFTVRSDGTRVVGQPGALHRAISNLAENAAKFDRSGTAPIEIVVEGARVEVRDRGPGIADEDLDRVFDRFYRSAEARSLPGSGLGLSIVREVARAHGGEAFAAPRPGGGAEIGFTVGRQTGPGRGDGGPGRGDGGPADADTSGSGGPRGAADPVGASGGTPAGQG